MRLRTLIFALLSFWLAFGSAMASVVQAAADRPCESMTMTIPADDCCGGGMEQAKCLAACLAVAPVMLAPTPQSVASAVAATHIAKPCMRHASIVAPPDIAPPKVLVS